jgi:4-amino-4-deoxy-L-arabinose transferase-like glycosyltransferase
MSRSPSLLHRCRGRGTSHMRCLLPTLTFLPLLRGFRPQSCRSAALGALAVATRVYGREKAAVRGSGTYMRCVHNAHAEHGATPARGGGARPPVSSRRWRPGIGIEIGGGSNSRGSAGGGVAATFYFLFNWFVHDPPWLLHLLHLIVLLLLFTAPRPASSRLTCS